MKGTPEFLQKDEPEAHYIPPRISQLITFRRVFREEDHHRLLIL